MHLKKKIMPNPNKIFLYKIFFWLYFYIECVYPSLAPCRSLSKKESCKKKGENAREREPVAATRPEKPNDLSLSRSHVVLTGNRASPWGLDGYQSWSVRSSFNQPVQQTGPRYLEQFAKIYVSADGSVVGDIAFAGKSNRVIYIER